MDDGFDPLEGLTPRQRLGLRQLLLEVHHAPSWSWQLPVLLRQRCWLKLERISLDEPHRWLPPDAREDAPELVRFRALRAQGVPPQQAEEQCWLEFGMANCRQALQRFWERQDEPRPAWTTHHYLELVSRYRRSFESGRPCIPMLVLPRAGSVTGHELHWVSDSTPPMRHTCA